ncbi:Fetal and adult testis-expressed transcript protein [Sciurus carolinensis]|uniref:Fetal and adult testis-expressed transcript protein n=1 Tax=Sciurus carolinensis TaxID=30640 RepID=A0AA41MFT2_SCICA|nr:Fetal and adult testis-expressed transcript protein [Sciurus carolinensis]
MQPRTQPPATRSARTRDLGAKLAERKPEQGLRSSPGGQMGRKVTNKAKRHLGGVSKNKDAARPPASATEASRKRVPTRQSHSQELKKKGHQLQKPRMSREPGHGNAHPQEYPGSFQGMRFHYERNPEAEIGLEELNGLEMEIMRRQLHMITGRLRALEDQGATWRHREAVFFTLLVSACIANLWLWMRQ